MISIYPQYVGDRVQFTVESGVLPYGLSLNPSTGVIMGQIDNTTIRNIVTIKVSNEVGFCLCTLSFSAYQPLTLLFYPQSIFNLTKGVFFTISPDIIGDYPSFNITSGSLPTGITLNSDSGIISGIPSSPVISQNVTIEASNPVGRITTELQFIIMNPPVNTPLIGSVIVLVVVILLLLVLVVCYRNRKPTLPMKTIDEVKSVEKRVSKPVIVDNDSELVSNEDKPTMSTEPLEITVELDSTTLTVVESTTAVEPTTIVEPVVASQGDENIPQVVEIPNPTSENKE